jgi:AcrR family transcriptional regulator
MLPGRETVKDRMMTIVDHDERRQRIAEVAFELIAREGLDAATIRRIAAEVGYSTTAITHYFAEKQELLAWVYQTLIAKYDERFRAAISHDPSDLVSGLLSATAADETSIRYWRVYIAFWERAARDPAFREQQRQDMTQTVQEIGAIISTYYPHCRDVERASRMLTVIVEGISIQVLVDRQSWSPMQIQDALAREVAALLGDATVAGSCAP